MLSALDMYSIGIGPSSSHTVGPMRAARTFALELASTGVLDRVARVHVELFGSLGATGRGHGSDTAVVLGLLGERPETVDVDQAQMRAASVRDHGLLRLAGTREIRFDWTRDLTLHLGRSLPGHPNAMTFTASDAAGELLHEHTSYSVGGGFVVDESELDAPAGADDSSVPFTFSSAEELLRLCAAHDLSISELMWRNELALRSEDELRTELLGIWTAMQECVENGCTRPDGVLPGGLEVRRRAPRLFAALRSSEDAGPVDDPLHALEWVNLFALAVNEENASGGRVVTAPTNGAAGIIPAVLHYYARFIPGADADGVIRFLLTAAAIGILFKSNASISGAEVGCQGEVGSACSMAAAGLAEVLGATPAQVENAAEIGIEHNLGLTCDPIGGLVQIPCIERNAIASTKAINAARMALRGDGTHHVTLDQAIATMRETGADMHDKYKETSRGGLAVNVVAC
ncbi:L-serine ammonia-lyase [Agromyces aerolatus]|uniref:L-serine ammonia-lyase n=1 Tax=Agromyces sp. LY-1074 TaxID=3074080 RepID=UPI0028561918|nr:MULTISPECIES: L-serine ammonia-lyase [unclassified Agromyces]MDR5699282.1 L-serine ammonia-lyase [Agromyces sp. LY-1074]MDR5705578.1 L-serine ammonia-lyase [Agromyces sp. LY-1358]